MPGLVSEVWLYYGTSLIFLFSNDAKFIKKDKGDYQVMPIVLSSISPS